MTKKTTLLLTLLTLAAFAAQAGPVSPSQAESIARQFATNASSPFKAKSTSMAGAVAKVAYTATSETDASHNLLYVVNSGDGYVVVAGDDAAPDMVLGYSTDGGQFDYDNAPENLRYWLGEYARQIEYMANNGLTADQLAPAATFDTEVAPMITTQWDQDAPYNDQCPVLNGKRTYTGCVATAMAQLMNYHEWPKQGTGSHSYTWNSQTLSADFGSTTYDWDNMADTYDGSNSNAENEAVATLMYHCGVSVNMSYMQDASGAQSNSAANALVSYFGYPANVQIISRDYRTYDEWVAIMKGEIDAGRPVLFGAQSTIGGHEFLLDGYNRDGYFHVNWGWSGTSDGYYLIATLNPYDGQGIGGGSDSGFKFMQDAVINVEPPTNETVYEEFYEICTTSFTPSSITSTTGGSARMEYGTLMNMGRQYINAKVGLRIVNSKEEEVFSAFDNYPYTVSPGYYMAFSASVGFTIPSDLDAGDYQIYPTYLMNGTEKTGPIHVDGNSYQYVQMTVDADGNVTFSSPTSIYDGIETSNFKVTQNPTFTSGQNATVTVDITNNSDQTFSGSIAFILTDENASQTLYSPSSLLEFGVCLVEAGETTTVELTQLISNFSPDGSYCQIALINSNGTVIGTPQLIKVSNPTVRLNGAPTIADSNGVDCGNIQASATLINESGNEEYTGTVSASILANGRFTTLDSKNVTIEAGSSTIIDFSGIFDAGEVGKTYQLFIIDAAGKRLMPYTAFTVGKSLEQAGVDNVAATTVGAYPNPVTDRLNLQATQPIMQVAIYAISGAQVAAHGGNGSQSMQIDMGGLPAGTYFVRIATADGIKTVKVIKK